jgi:hypothetical protein
MSPLTTGLLMVIGVALIAWLLRRMSGGAGIDRQLLSGSAPAPPLPEEAAPEPAGPEEEEEDEEESTEVAAITSDGLTFVPFDDGVELLIPGPPEQMEEHLARRAQGGRAAGMLVSGDLIGARVVRGAPGVDPWRLEALGRDQDYLAWAFETEEAARVALDMLARAVVKPPLDADGEPAPPGPAAYEEARHVHEVTLQELAMMPEGEEPEEPGS